MTNYDEGFAAALDGQYDCENPYAVGSDESDSWLDGWANGMAHESAANSREYYSANTW